MRKILVALVIETPHGVSRDVIKDGIEEGITNLWFMADATLKAIVLEKDMPIEEQDKGCDEIVAHMDTL